MEPFEVYTAIVASIKEQDVKSVANLMLQHIGEDHPITLSDICTAVFGAYNPNTDRKTRLILDDLIEVYRIPIGAYSGKSGRWICKDDAEVIRVTDDLESRVKSTNARIRALRMANIPVREPQFDRPRQQSLWK
jgi:hypothetical protein